MELNCPSNPRISLQGLPGLPGPPGPPGPPAVSTAGTVPGSGAVGPPGRDGAPGQPVGGYFTKKNKTPAQLIPNLSLTQSPSSFSSISRACLVSEELTAYLEPLDAKEKRYLAAAGGFCSASFQPSRASTLIVVKPPDGGKV